MENIVDINIPNHDIQETIHIVMLCYILLSMDIGMSWRLLCLHNVKWTYLNCKGC